MNGNPFKIEDKRVLLVDDVEINLQVAGAILQKDDMEILHADSGRKALQLLRGEKVDLLLLDIMMPGMDGFAVMETINSDSSIPDIPVIFLTARNDEESLTRAFELGAVDYITKPFRGGELRMRVRTHLQLRHIQRELEEANATKDKFFSIIAHDLRSPFNSLLGMTQYLAGGGIEELEADTAKEMLLGIHRSSKNVYNLLENLLEWSRIQTGRFVLKPELIKLSELITENLELLDVSIKEKELLILNNVQNHETAYADRNAITMVLRNLLSNAVKFTPRGGTIQVECSTNEGSTVLSVEDSGTGIDAELRDKLFQIGHRQSRPGTEMEKGSGLGLVLCKEFVERSGGRIEVQSEAGQGSRFSFSIPTQAPAD